MVKIGWSEVDITPEKGMKIALDGEFYERITDEVESPITVTAFALESDGDQMIICSCDLLSVGANLVRIVREKLAGQIDIPLDKIIINAIHSHTSWVYKRDEDTYCARGKEYLKNYVPKDMIYEQLVSYDSCVSPEDALMYIAERVAVAIKRAWDNRTAGLYQNAFGRAAVGMNRRVCYDDGSAKMWGDTNHPNFENLEGGNDSGIELIYTFDMNKKLTGVIANVACPAQVVEHRSIISSDYWGKVKENLRLRFGDEIFVLGLCSAAGDQCPRDMIRWVNPETEIKDPNIKRENLIERRADPSMFDISGLKVVGRRISNEIISVYEELPDDYKDEGILIHKTMSVSLPLRKVTIKERDDSIETINRFVEKNRGKTISYVDSAALHVCAGNIARFELQKTTDLFNVEVHVIRLGDIAIATNPFELFLDYGNKIRARSKAKQTILIQLACGSEAYLPTARAENGSHYSAYVSSGVTGHVGGDMLVRETLDCINKLF